MNTQSSNQNAGFDPAPLVIDMGQPGFFPYARFSRSNSRNRRVQPLTQCADFAVWPNVVPQTPEDANPALRKKARGVSDLSDLS